MEPFALCRAGVIRLVCKTWCEVEKVHAPQPTVLTLEVHSQFAKKSYLRWALRDTLRLSRLEITNSSMGQVREITRVSQKEQQASALRISTTCCPFCSPTRQAGIDYKLACNLPGVSFGTCCVLTS